MEQPTSTVEIVIHVNMLKEGWDVKNLYTIIPIRASVSEILTEQTIGRGLRLPFGEVTGDPDLDALEIVSHDQYAALIREARNSPVFRFREISPGELRPVKTVQVSHKYVDLCDVLDKLQQEKTIFFTSELTDEQRLNQIVGQIVAGENELYRAELAATENRPAAEGRTLELFPQQPRLFDPAARAEDLKTTLKNYAEVNIDVPYIITDAYPERDFQPFDAKVNVGPFELVDQRLLAHDLATGCDRQRIHGR